MKKARIMITTFLSVILVATTFVTTVHAADAIWSSRFRSFPTLSVSTRKSQFPFTYSLQVFLWETNDAYQEILKKHGGIDGDYAGGTAEAVSVFQDDVSIVIDGVCGPDTWYQVGSMSWDELAGNYMFFEVGGYYYLRAERSYPYTFYYANPDGEYPNWTYLITP